MNDKPVYELRFRFKTFSGPEALATARNHEPERLEDDAEEPLVYDPADPSSAVLLDELPGRPRLDVDSVTQTEGSVLPLLVLPTVTVLGHTAWLLIR